MKISARKAKGRGLFLAELMIALALFMITFITLLGVLTSGSDAIAAARDRVAAQSVATQVLEFQYGLGFSYWTTGAAQAAPYTYGAASGVTTVNDTVAVSYATRGTTVTLQYFYALTVTPCDVNGTSPPVGPAVWRDIHVEVDWNVNNTSTTAWSPYTGPVARPARTVHLSTTVAQ